jgi:hypothetical protein
MPDRRRDIAAGAVPSGAWDRAADMLTAAVALTWLARLVPQALAARLQTDECFHAWVSRWVGGHGRLPGEIPGLYGGFPYFYPPLFHVAGGAAFALGDERGFRLANVAVVALLLAVIALGARRLASRDAARWAVCLAVANRFLAVHAVRLYAEALSTLLVTASALLLARVWRTPRRRDALLLGVGCGLAILTKLSALVLPPVLAGLAAVEWGQARRGRSAALALAAGVAVLVAAPWLVHVAMRFGSPFYPALGRDVHPLLLRLNEAHFTPAARKLWAEMAARAGPATWLAVAGALLAGARARRGGTELAIVGGCVALVLLAPLQPLLESRHLLPLVVAADTLSAVALGRAIGPASRGRVAVDLVTLAFAAAAALGPADLRAREDLDEPAENLAAFAAVRAHVPAGDVVLARETYDVLWYADRAADWPVPFGQADPPLGAFRTADPDSIARDLARHHLRWVLLTDDAGPASFDGGDWPQPTLDGLARLVAGGRATEAWRDGDRALLRLGP